MMRKKIASLMALAAIAALLWLGQLRYAWHPVLEQDRFAGASYTELRTRLGRPVSEQATVRRGYEMEPGAAFNRIVVYQPLWGKLLLYFRNERCVGSVFYTRGVRF